MSCGRRCRSCAPVTTEQPIDTPTAAGKASLDMLGVFTGFETALRRERQMEGIAKAEERGVYEERSPSEDAAGVRSPSAEGKGSGEIAAAAGASRSKVRRVSKIEAAKESGES